MSHFNADGPGGCVYGVGEVKIDTVRNGNVPGGFVVLRLQDDGGGNGNLDVYLFRDDARALARELERVLLDTSGA